MRSLVRILDSASHDPGKVEAFCKRTFEFVSVGYVSGIDKMQIACFDSDRCRICIQYQYWPKLGAWTYDLFQGNQYRQPEREE